MIEKAGIAMICKYCGQQMDPADAVCPHCHNPAAPLVGGNGFWEMAKASPAPQPPAPPVRTVRNVPQNPVVRPPVPQQKKQNPAFGILTVISLVLSILTLILLVSSHHALKKSLELQQQSLSRMQSRPYNYEIVSDAIPEAEPAVPPEEELAVPPEAALWAEHEEAAAIPPALKIITEEGLNRIGAETDYSAEENYLRCTTDRENVSFHWARWSDNRWENLSLWNGTDEFREDGLTKTTLYLPDAPDCLGTYQCTAMMDHRVCFIMKFSVTEEDVHD